MIRVAILGAGIGAQHLDAFRKLPHLFKTVCVVDQNVERAKALEIHATEFDIREDISDALADPSIDLIDICFPPHLHVSVTIRALEAGKHVVCEKPLATSLRDAISVQRAANNCEKQVFPVFQYRWGTPLAQLRHLIKTGVAGAPQMAALETHWSRGSDYYSVPWRGTWQGEQGGAVLGHAIHSHDLLTHFMGPVAAVSAFTTTRINNIETEDCAAISFEMQNGALATSNITLGAANNETRLRFVFENLTATSGKSPYAPGAEPWTFTARDPALQSMVDTTVLASPDEDYGYTGFFQSLSNGLHKLSDNFVSLNAGVQSIELVTAIYQSANQNTRVCLPLGTDDAFYGGWKI